MNQQKALWLVLAFSCAACGAGEVQDLVEETRNLTSVDGSAVGPTGHPGAFYLIAQKLYGTITAPEIEKLLTDPDPEVACMGIVLLAQDFEKNREKIRKFVGDKRKIAYGPLGCISWEITVGDFVQQLLKNEHTRGCFRVTRKSAE